LRLAARPSEAENPENLAEKQKKELGSLKDMCLKTSRAYEISLGHDSIKATNNSAEGEALPLQQRPVPH
jgi:hypothetical protein